MQQGFKKNMLAGLMVLLIAFSITPKIMLHDLIADHKDGSYHANDTKTKLFDPSGFHCHCDNLVVESPFMDDGVSLGFIPLTFHQRMISLSANHFHCSVQFNFALRGPPSPVIA
jgi:hypothetical protein